MINTITVTDALASVDSKGNAVQSDNQLMEKVNIDEFQKKVDNQRDRIKAQKKADANNKELADKESKITKDSIVKEFGSSEKFIQEKQDEGLTLSEINSTLGIMRDEGIAFDKAKEKIHKQPVNKSNEAKSSITTDVPVTNLNTLNNFSLSTTQPEQISKPDTKISEAPYQVALHHENISTLSGSLSVNENELTLPGRNGLSFTLKRSYDSNSSQLYDTQVGIGYTTTYTYTYYVNFNATIQRANYYYYLTRIYKTAINKYDCSTGQWLWGPGQGPDLITSSQYSTYNSYVQGINNPPSIPSATAHACGSIPSEPNRYYTYSYTYSSYGGSSGYGSFAPYGSTTDSYGPYSLYSDAVNVMNSISPGANYKSSLYGSDSSGYYMLNYYYASSPNASISTISTPSGNTSYTYNQLINAPEDNRFPIGKGWKWNVPYLEFKNGKTIVNLIDEGAYEVSGNTLKDYSWSDLSFTSDSSVSVNGVTSSYVLKSTFGVNRYFDNSGNLLQISDLYGNKIQFAYTSVSPYGNVLSSITDAAGNKINIQYSTTQVTLTKGSQTIVYKKVTQNGKELLSQVVDPAGRVTTYDYAIKNANFNLLGTTPTTNNPYALLTGITHPTGAKSVYDYETLPVTRYIGNNMVDQVYRMASRKDVVTYTDATTQEFNHVSVVYNGDMNSSYNLDYAFSTKLFDDLTESTFDYKKDFIADGTAPVYYNTKLSKIGDTTEQVSEFAYDEVKRRTEPITTKVYYRNTTTGATSLAATSSAQYDDYKHVVSVTDPLGATSSYVYDSTTNWLNSSVEPVDGTSSAYIQYTRNAQGDSTEMIIRDSSASGAVLKDTQYEYDSYGNMVTVREKDVSRDAVSRIEFSSTYGAAFPTKITNLYKDADGIDRSQVIQGEYEPGTGRLTAFIDGNNIRTGYTYDVLGRVKQVTNPDASTLSWTYNDTANEVTSVNEAGLTVINKWNPLGLQVESGIMDAGVYKNKSKNGYDVAGRVAWSEDAAGYRTIYTYDDWNRNIQTNYPDQSQNQTAYDDIARTAISYDGEGNAVRTTLDIAGRAVKAEESINGGYQNLWTKAYDFAGNVIEQKDAKGQSTQFSYNPLSQLTSVTNANLETTRYEYDRLGNQTRLVYPDSTAMAKQYDELGRLTKQIDPLNNASTFYYDGNGNRAKLIDRKGQPFTYTYSNRGLLTQKASPTDTIAFTYNPDGSRKSMTDSTGTTSYAYKATGELQQITYPDSKTISYDYDVRGNRNHMTSPFAKPLDYTYDEMNRLKSVTVNGTNEASYSYLRNGLLKDTMLGNQMTASQSYTGVHLTGLQHKKADGSTTQTFTYGYDPNGNMINRVENSTQHTFSYDALDRISTSSQFNEAYSYDARGNRLTMDSTQAPVISGATYEYDEWDRLSKATTEDGKVVSYKYNGDDLMVERTENGETTRYYYDGTNIVAEAKVVNGQPVEKASYVRGLGLIDRVDAGGSKAYYLRNGHWDVVELRDGNGAVLNQYSYDIWGNPQQTVESVENPFRYSGEYWDKSVSLQYLRARWYDPTMGRFLNEDTYQGDIKNPLSLNGYTFVSNNPLTNIDPSGHWCTSSDGKWSHPGACNGGSNNVAETNDINGSKYTPDTPDEIGKKIKENGQVISKATQGIIVHQLIQDYFLQKYGHVSLGGAGDVEFPVPVSGNSSGMGRVDIMLQTFQNKEFYEIKPITYKTVTVLNLMAQEQLNEYITGYNGVNGLGASVKGTTFNPNNETIGFGTQTIKMYTYYNNNSQKGLIFYVVTNKKGQEVTEHVYDLGPVEVPESIPFRLPMPEGFGIPEFVIP
jgi:RHS repeat-associated protein